MLKNKTRRSSATSPNKPAKTARIATDTARATARIATDTTRATATARVKTARIATDTARARATATARATKVFKPSYIIPLTRTVSPNTPTNSGNYPYTSTKMQYKTFIEELNKIFTNEKIINREDKVGFKELLAEQKHYNKLIYKISPSSIVCFVVCNYYGESLIFNKYNDHNGDVAFNELLRENNMGMIWLNYNTLYIHKYI